MLFYNNEWVVATKPKGLVITSPDMHKACKAEINANVPFIFVELLLIRLLIVSLL